MITLSRPGVMRTTKLHRICGCGDSSEERRQKRAAPGVSPGGRAERKCPSLVSGALLSHGLTPQYHRRWGA